MRSGCASSITESPIGGDVSAVEAGGARRAVGRGRRSSGRFGRVVVVGGGFVELLGDAVVTGPRRCRNCGRRSMPGCDEPGLRPPARRCRITGQRHKSGEINSKTDERLSRDGCIVGRRLKEFEVCVSTPGSESRRSVVG